MTDWKPGQPKEPRPQEGKVAGLLLARWKNDDDQWLRGLDRLRERMDMLPTVPEHEVNSIVDGGKLGFRTMHKPVHLSERETSLLEALANGMTSGEWAHREGVQMRTAQAHAYRARIRMRAKTRTHAVALAVHLGLVKVAPRVGVPRKRIYMRGGLSRPLMENLWHIARGLSNEEIAAERGLSTETVKTQVKALHAILGSRNRAHAVAIAFSLGLLHFGKEFGLQEEAA